MAAKKSGAKLGTAALATGPPFLAAILRFEAGTLGPPKLVDGGRETEPRCLVGDRHCADRVGEVAVSVDVVTRGQSVFRLHVLDVRRLDLVVLDSGDVLA